MKKIILLIIGVNLCNLSLLCQTDIDYILIPKFCHHSACSWALANSELMKPVDTDVLFDASFTQSCYYEIDNQTGWNKLYRLEKYLSHKDRSLRLGWRTNQKTKNLEIGLYAHIDYNIESISLDFFPDFNAYNKYYMHMKHDGMYVRAGNNSYCIKREIFNPEIYYVTGTAGGAYFGGDQAAPHGMDMWVKNIEWNTQPSFWDEGANKGFCNSIFYPDDILTYQASNSIKAPLDDTHDGDPNYTTVQSGSNLTFIAGESINLYEGFHAKQGSHFVAKIINHPQVISEPDFLIPTICYLVNNVNKFNFSLYLDKQFTEFITGGTGTIIENNACYTISSEIYETIPNGHYYVISNFSNKWFNIIYKHDIFKVDKYSNITFMKDSIYISKSTEVSLEQSNINFSDSNNLIIITDIKIYPNPNQGIFTIEFNENNLSNYSVEVINSIGKTIYKKQNVPMGKYAIDISDQPRGIYFIKIITGTKTYTQKVIYK